MFSSGRESWAGLLGLVAWSGICLGRILLAIRYCARGNSMSQQRTRQELLGVKLIWD